MALQIIIILSLVQGITEFLPISSSAHLIIIPEFLFDIESSRGFDVSLHFGSLLAVIYYLKKDLIKMISDTIFFKKDNEYSAVRNPSLFFSLSDRFPFKFIFCRFLISINSDSVEASFIFMGLIN